jgi:nitrate reductase NapAB chaperone NapD
MHMPIASAVIDIKDGTSEAVLGRLAHIPRISVYGVKENQFVTVIEGLTINDVDATVKEVSMIEEVLGVYPVFVGEHE